MAKYERTLVGDFEELLNHVHNDIVEGNLSAAFEDGSQAVLFKINTIGEETFLDQCRESVERYIAQH